MTSQVAFQIKQGETWRRVVRWEQGTYVYVPITAIAKVAPVSLTVPNHGLVDNWRFAVSNVEGMTEINAENEPPEESEYHRATVVDSNTLEINKVNALGYSTYTAGGIIRYRPPVDLGGFEARMQIRKSAKDATVLFSLESNPSTDPQRIFLDNTFKTITLLITDEETELFTFSGGVYDLELINAGGEVSIILSGSISIVKNVTR